MSEISLRKYAESRKTRGLPGGSLASVQRAIAAGRVTLTGSGQIDPDAADRQWAARSATRPNHLQAPAAPAPEDLDAGLVAYGDYCALDAAFEALVRAFLAGDAKRAPALMEALQVNGADAAAVEVAGHTVVDVVASLRGPR